MEVKQTRNERECTPSAAEAEIAADVYLQEYQPKKNIEDCSISQLAESLKQFPLISWTQTLQDEVNDQRMERISKAPSLVASTSDTYCCSIAESKRREGRLKDTQSPEQDVTGPVDTKDEELEANYFKSAQWCDPITSSSTFLTML